MTDNEIIKALECCGEGSACTNCPLFECKSRKCISELNIEALDLIKRQQAEIKRLWEDCDYFEDKVKTIKSEAITEFTGRLKDYLNGDRVYDRVLKCLFDDIDNLVKEMAEGDNG